MASKSAMGPVSSKGLERNIVGVSVAVSAAATYCWLRVTSARDAVVSPSPVSRVRCLGRLVLKSEREPHSEVHACLALERAID